MSVMVTETWAASFYVNFRDLLSWPQVGSYRVNAAGKGREGLGKREPDKDGGSALRSHTGQPASRVVDCQKWKRLLTFQLKNRNTESLGEGYKAG